MSRSLLVVLFAILLAMGLPASSVAQSTIDPSIDSDGDGANNQRDFDDDNDKIVDDEDCAPFDASIGRECPQQPPPPEPTRPPKVDPTSPPAPPTSAPLPTAVPDTDSHVPTPSTTDHGLDSDGDGIANSHDPDDDNDGVTDAEDSAPFDPNAGSNPPPSIIDRDSDSDGDGIANSHDPDDDNDGTADDRDCAPFDASVSSCQDRSPDDPGSAGGNTDNGSGHRSERFGGLYVTTLPTTGSGSSILGGSMILVWIGMGLAGFAMIMIVRGRRHG